MAAVNIQKLVNGNVFINGVGLFGAFEEVTLPQIKEKSAEHKALGMVGTLKYPAGFDEMTMKIKWNGPYDDALIHSAGFFTNKLIMVRGSRDTYNATGGRTSQELVLAYVNGRPTSFPALGMKPMDNVEAETDFTVSYYKLEIGGREIVCFDAVNQIYRVDGVDQLATYRAQLGIG